MLFDRQQLILESAASRGFRTDLYRKSQIKPTEFGGGRILLRQEIIHSRDAREMEIFMDRRLMTAEDFLAYAAAPLVSKGEIYGVLEVFFRTCFTFDGEWLFLLETLAGQASIAIENSIMFSNLKRSHLDLALSYDLTIEGWSYALDLRDKETEFHTRRVTEIALRLAREMEFPQDQLAHFRRGALLHDIGKISIPDSILFKPAPLDKEEWKIMKDHPRTAMEMLSRIEYLRPAVDIPYCHHEKWDGTGYPRGLKGNEIPLAARIFAVVDVYDALTSDRPYRKAWPVDKTMNYIREQAGKSFDPKVVQVFLAMMKKKKS